MAWKAMVALLAGAGLGGCASTMEARRDYRVAEQEVARAEEGPAVRYAPSDLGRARAMLEESQRAFDEGDAEEADRFARNAIRSARDAEATAERAAPSAYGEEERVRGERPTADERPAQPMEQTPPTLQTQQMTDWQAIRDQLQGVATVRQGARGIVIELPAGTLFTIGSSALAPDAQAKLDRVASVLGGRTFRRLLVEAHSGIRSGESRSLELAQARAGAVANYLEAHGCSPEQVAAIGIAENVTPEGQADIHDVEIVLVR